MIYDRQIILHCYINDFNRIIYSTVMFERIDIITIRYPIMYKQMFLKNKEGFLLLVLRRCLYHAWCFEGLFTLAVVSRSVI